MPKLQKLKYKTYEEFLAIRSSLEGFGGSDVGTVMGLNPYKSQLQFFHEKIGLHNPIRKDSPPMYRGRVLEDVVVKAYWQYHDPENPVMDVLLENAASKNIVRKCKKVNSIIINPEYPWLFTSIDYQINGGGVLEIKTDTGYGSFKWEGDINPSHIVQHQQQLLVSGMTWGEIATLTDATWFKSIPFQANNDIQNNILSATKEFYHRIQAAKAILVSPTGTEEEKLAQVQELEPDPEGTEGYEKYLKEHYKAENNHTIQGDDEAYDWAKKYVQANTEVKSLEEIKQLNKNLLLKTMIDAKANAIDFGANGKVFIQKDGKINIKVS